MTDWIQAATHCHKDMHIGPRDIHDHKEAQGLNQGRKEPSKEDIKQHRFTTRVAKRTQMLPI
jgi:hypothetical protein